MRVPVASSTASRRGVVVLGAALLTGLVVTLAARGLGWGQVVLHECVPGDGPLGVLGVRVAILRSSAQCADGTFAIGPGGPVIASVALGTLLVGLLLVGGGVGLAGLGARTARAARAVAMSVLRALPVAPTPPPTVRADAPVTVVIVAVRAARRPHGTRPHRGPPQLAV